MSIEEIMCGSLKRRSVKYCAERAALAIRELPDARTVCVDPTGRVTVEHPDKAIEADILGTWKPDHGIINLYRDIRGELAFEAERRGWRRKGTVRRAA
ncbi:hypothetical protein [Pseudoxanthomonas beigongshangi]